ncbi:hypothetical protein [Nitrospira sp. Kam-Ns4a]
MSCSECAQKDRTIAGLREAVARWRARAEQRAPREPGLVRESLDTRGIHRVVRETDYPASMAAHAVWAAVERDYPQATVERIETRKGVWLVHLVE